MPRTDIPVTFVGLRHIYKTYLKLRNHGLNPTRGVQILLEKAYNYNLYKVDLRDRGVTDRRRQSQVFYNMKHSRRLLWAHIPSIASLNYSSMAWMRRAYHMPRSEKAVDMYLTTMINIRFINILHVPGTHGITMDWQSWHRPTPSEQLAIHSIVYSDRIQGRYTPKVNNMPINPNLIPILHSSNLSAAELYPVLYPEGNVLSGDDFVDTHYTQLSILANLYMTPYADHPDLMFNEDTAKAFYQPNSRRWGKIVIPPTIDEVSSIRQKLFPYFTAATVRVGDDEYTFPSGRRRSLYEIATDPIILEKLASGELSVLHVAHICGFTLETFLFMFILPIISGIDIIDSFGAKRNISYEEYHTKDNADALGIGFKDKETVQSIKSFALHYDFYKAIHPFAKLFFNRSHRFKSEIIGKYGIKPWWNPKYYCKALADINKKPIKW